MIAPRGKGDAEGAAARAVAPLSGKSNGMQLSGQAELGLIALSSFLASFAMLCISASKVDGKEQYVFVTVTFLGEFCKLCAVTAAYFYTKWSKSEEHAYTQLADEPAIGLLSSERLLYAVPAFLYMLDNNLAFVILRYIDPATQSLLWNIKILQTAFLFRYILGRRLTVLQHCAVMMLFFGIVGSQSAKIHHCKPHAPQEPDDKSYVVGYLLVFLGTSITSSAGIYTEYVLKRRSGMGFFEQQIQLYFYGILFNGLVLLVRYRSLLVEQGFFHGYNKFSCAVVIFMTCNGLATATIFKYLDNIMNVYTQAGTMIITTLMSSFLGLFRPTVAFLCGASICVVSMYIYKCPASWLLSGAPVSFYEEAGSFQSSSKDKKYRLMAE